MHFTIIKSASELAQFFDEFDARMKGADGITSRQAAGRSYWPEFSAESADGIRQTPRRDPAS